LSLAASATRPGSTVVLAALAALVALSTPIQARAEIGAGAAPIVQHYLEATGGRDTSDGESTLHLRGHIEADGLSGRWEMWQAAPDRWVRRFDIGPLHVREGFDGEVAWRTDLSDKSVTVLSAAEAAHAREDGWFFNERWALDDQGGGDVRLGSRTYGASETYDHLLVTAPGGRPRHLLINQRTGFLEKVTTEIDGHLYSELPGKYRMLGGRKRPSLYTSPTLLPGDKPLDRMTVDSVWVNPPLDSTAFAPPPVKERAITWAQSERSVRVPFAYVSRCVLVKVSINGAPPVDFILDTGAELSLLDRDFAYGLGLRPEGESQVQGVAASASTQFVKLGAITLAGEHGGATLKDFRAVVLDLAESQQYVLWRKTAGILGADFLSRFVVTIDYDAQTVTLDDPAQFTYAGAGAAVPFELYSGVPLVDLTLNQGCSGKFLVDVGNAFQFVVHGSAVRSCQMLSNLKRRDIEASGGGIGGGFVSSMCRLDSVRIGPFSLPEPIAALTLTRDGGMANHDLAGNIGNSVLERFRCTFDYAHRVLYLEPGSRFAEREHVSRFGAILVRNGSSVYAGGILRGSGAYVAGLKWFDQIVAVDGKPLENWTREEIDRVLTDGPAGAVHSITFRDLVDEEHTVEVTLTDPL
jgi:hypothetical protein